MPPVILRLQILPLREHVLVRLHLRPCLGPFEAIPLELADEVVEDKGVGSLVAILWQDTDQQQIHDVRLMPIWF